MKLTDLSTQQARDLADKVAPVLGFLVRLTDRMQQRGWDAEDPAYVAAWQARHALHELRVRLHYRALDCGYDKGGGLPK